VVGFPRPQGLPVDLERFYALGIDAQRVAAQLADGRSGFAFDGVTGRIDVRGGGVVERTPRLATFREGAPVGE
jgi:outer membrane PBP1 activator LpoA protein